MEGIPKIVAENKGLYTDIRRNEQTIFLDKWNVFFKIRKKKNNNDKD